MKSVLVIIIDGNEVVNQNILLKILLLVPGKTNTKNKTKKIATKMVILLLWYFVKYHKRWYSGKKFFLFITIHVQKEIFFSGNYKNVHIYIVSYNSNKQQTLNPFFQLNEEAHIRYREKYFFSFRLKIGSRPQMFSSKMYSFDFEVKKIYIFLGRGEWGGVSCEHRWWARKGWSRWLIV